MMKIIRKLAVFVIMKLLKFMVLNLKKLLRDNKMLKLLKKDKN
jgi:hypothetical protein